VERQKGRLGSVWRHLEARSRTRGARDWAAAFPAERRRRGSCLLWAQLLPSAGARESVEEGHVGLGGDSGGARGFDGWRRSSSSERGGRQRWKKGKGGREVGRRARDGDGERDASRERDIETLTGGPHLSGRTKN
jgi:hypothetical protein